MGIKVASELFDSSRKRIDDIPEMREQQSKQRSALGKKRKIIRKRLKSQKIKIDYCS